MTTWALVPLKNLAQAKSRLEPAVDDDLRRELVLAMAADVLHALRQVGRIDRILVVSNEPEAGSLLREHGLDIFYSSDGEGLNRELEQAAAYAAAHGADRVLITHADLPWLSPARLEHFLSQCPEDGVCAAQDKLGSGTNAIFAPVPLPVPLVFGVDSLPAFRTGAAERGVNLRVVKDSRLAHDIDRPEDFERLLDQQTSGLQPGASTASVLQRLNPQRAERMG